VLLQSSVSVRKQVRTVCTSGSVQRNDRRANEDVASQSKDKAYRRYALAVERALGSFDTAQQEWADYISFLNRLLKALQTHPPNNNAVPDSQMVATRLAQCLKPSLPSGVHQKALEVFAYLFSVIGVGLTQGNDMLSKLI
jgi:hypothetical protein